MTRTKITISALITAIFLATQVIAVGAAPATQDTTPITGTVESITPETDTETGTTTVVVTLTDNMGEMQTIRLNLEDATALGLVTNDSSGNPIADNTVIDTTVEIDPATVIPEQSEEEKQHPVGSAISDFFSDLLGVDYEMVMEYHNEGTGFGVIAQALWMTNALEGDTELFSTILDAKKNKDYSGITLPDGNTPKNWGQFRKAVMKDREKAKENLGAIMSGRADGEQDGTQVESQNNGNSDKKNYKKDNGKGKDKDKNKNK